MNKKIQKIFLLLTICFFSYSTKAQRDLITTYAGEEIRCKILDETPNRFIYAYLGPKNKVLRNEIFKTLVSSFKYNHYNEDILKNDKLNRNKSSSGESRIDIRKSSKSSRRSKKEKDEEPSKKNSSEKDKVSNAIKVEEKTTSDPIKEIVTKESEKLKPDTATTNNPAQKPTNELKKTENTEPLAKEIAKTNETTTNAKDLKKEEAKIVEKKDAEQKIVDKKPADDKVVEQKAPEQKIVDQKVAEQKVADTKKDAAKTEIDKKEDLKKELAKKELEAKEKEEAKKLEEVLAKAKAKEEAKSPFAEPEPISEFKNYLKYRVGVKGGLGNIIQKNTDTSPYGLYKEKLLRGWMFGADAAYFINDKIGLGVMYNNYQANNSNSKLDYTDFISGETVKDGSLSNKVSHKFVGPTLLYRKAIDFKTFAVLSLSPGMHLYTDKGEANLSSYKHTGKAYGASATLGLDFLLGNDIYGRDIILSLEGGYNYGQITSLNYGGNLGTKTLAEPINLNRLDFSIGLRFTRFPVYLR